MTKWKTATLLVLAMLAVGCGTFGQPELYAPLPELNRPSDGCRWRWLMRKISEEPGLFEDCVRPDRRGRRCDDTIAIALTRACAPGEPQPIN